MRKGLVSILGMIAGAAMLRMLRRSAQSSRMHQKMDQLQDRFRPLDTV